MRGETSYLGADSALSGASPETPCQQSDDVCEPGTQLEDRISAKAEHESAKARATESLQVLGLELATAEQELIRLREAAARSQADREKLEALTKQVGELEREVSDLKRRTWDQEQTIHNLEVFLGEADSIRAQCEEADRLETQIEHFSQQFEHYLSLGQEYVQKTSERDAELRRMESVTSAMVSGFMEDLRPITSEQVKLNSEAAGLQMQLTGLHRQAALIDEVPCASGPMAETCKLLAEAREAKGRIDSIRTRIFEISARQTELGAAEQANADARLVVQEQGEADLDTARTRLQAEVDDILRQKTELGYDKGEHQAAINALAAVKPAREKLAGLAAAESKLETTRTAKVEDEKALETKQARLQEVRLEGVSLAEQLRGVQAFNVLPAETLVATLHGDINAQTRALASAETVLGQIAEAEAELSTLNKTLSAREHQYALADTLKEAFSRDGIPADIIGNAIPLIEEYANDLLSHLSDGRMSLKFVTQKATGKGSTAGIAETLDIYVSDASGERAYEDFSGGEQLRVNLAVRIAIGQVLAQRSGATIRTLLLDEVCSPLDQAGEDALVESITRLSAMFDCILLVTHRESLKDRLPQQIEVIKGSAGSEVRVA